MNEDASYVSMTKYGDIDDETSLGVFDKLRLSKGMIGFDLFYSLSFFPILIIKKVRKSVLLFVVLK